MAYQQAGNAKKPYLAQYSAVLEDSPVIKSCSVKINNIPTNNILNPGNITLSMDHADNAARLVYESFYADDNIANDIEFTER